MFKTQNGQVALSVKALRLAQVALDPVCVNSIQVSIQIPLTLQWLAIRNGKG